MQSLYDELLLQYPEHSDKIREYQNTNDDIFKLLFYLRVNTPSDDYSLCSSFDNDESAIIELLSLRKGFVLSKPVIYREI